MNKVKFRKKIENKYLDNRMKILNCKSNYRLITIEIEGYESGNLFYDVIIDLENLCYDAKIDFQFNKVVCFNKTENLYKTQYLIDEEQIKDFNIIWKQYKNDWISIRNNLIKESQKINKCNCTNLDMCKLQECECLCHSEQKKRTPEKWERKIAKNIIAKNIIVKNIRNYHIDSQTTQESMLNFFDFLETKDIEDICYSCPALKYNIALTCSKCNMLKKIKQNATIEE